MNNETRFRLSPEVLDLLKELSERLGISQASTIEFTVRRFAREQGISVSKRKARRG